MPMFTVERQYLVPVFQHLTLEADDAASACAAALDEEAFPWEGDKVDYDSARETTLIGLWTCPTAYDGKSLPLPFDTLPDA